jgi:hypothetical protein
LYFHQDVQDSAVEDRVDPVAEEGHGRQKRVLKRLLIIFSRKNGFLIVKNSGEKEYFIGKAIFERKRIFWSKKGFF